MSTRKLLKIYDQVKSFDDARIRVGLSLEDAMQLCEISERTLYRWRSQRTPRWAIRLIMSQGGTLDRFGWHGWEIRRGVLYNNELSHRYHWEPKHLLGPLFNITDPAALNDTPQGKLSSILAARTRRSLNQVHHDEVQPDLDFSESGQCTGNQHTHGGRRVAKQS